MEEIKEQAQPEKKKKSKRKIQFSKLLIVIESIIVAYLTYEGMELAKLCIMADYSGSLSWIITMVTCAWAAYGTSAGFYYSKAKAENTAGGITYDTAMNDVKERIDCE